MPEIRSRFENTGVPLSTKTFYCLFSGAPGGAKAGFPTEAVERRRFCFFTGVAAGCLVFLSIFALFPFLYSSSFPVPRSGSALLHVKYCNKNK